MSLQTRSSILAFSSDPNSKQSWGSPRLPARGHAMRPNRSCRDVIHYALLPFVDIVFHGIQTCLLECLLKRRIDPTTAWASAGHHVRHSSSCHVLEALQYIPHIGHFIGCFLSDELQFFHELLEVDHRPKALQCSIVCSETTTSFCALRAQTNGQQPHAMLHPVHNVCVAGSTFLHNFDHSSIKSASHQQLMDE